MPCDTAKALRTSFFAGIAFAAALAWAPPGEARVTRIVIDSDATTIKGTNLRGAQRARVRGARTLRSARTRSSPISGRAPGIPNGKVEYVASFLIRKPKDMASRAA